MPVRLQAVGSQRENEGRGLEFVQFGVFLFKLSEGFLSFRGIHVGRMGEVVNLFQSTDRDMGVNLGGG